MLDKNTWTLMGTKEELEGILRKKVTDAGGGLSEGAVNSISLE